MPERYLITGATGFVGGHLAEACAARGHAVSTIARASSDVALLQRLGATIHQGDLADAETVRKAVEGAEISVSPGDAKATTAADGTFSIDLAPGDYKVTVTKNGLKTQTLDVKIDPNGVAIQNIDLQK